MEIHMAGRGGSNAFVAFESGVHSRGDPDPVI